MYNRINVSEYDIRYTDVDYADRLKLSSLLSMMQEAACKSADELGFGYAVLQPRNIGFVIVNWHIDLYRPVKLGEKLIVRTWPIKPKRLIVFRDLELFVGEEKVGICGSRWCLVNLSTFSMLPASEVFAQNADYIEERVADISSWKIPSPECEAPVFSKVLAYSDCDHYMHVNNTKYMDFLCDVFTLNELKDKFFSSIDVSYVKQCKAGERIELFRQDFENETLVEGKVGGEVRVQMRVRFK